MRRLFLKHYIEYISLVNSGYLLLCLSPLTSTSLNYSIYFLLYYILILLFYGSIFSFFDNIENPGKRISFDTIFFEIEKKDHLSIILSIFLFFYLVFLRRGVIILVVAEFLLMVFYYNGWF